MRLMLPLAFTWWMSLSMLRNHVCAFSPEKSVAIMIIVSWPAVKVSWSAMSASKRATTSGTL